MKHITLKKTGFKLLNLLGLTLHSRLISSNEMLVKKNFALKESKTKLYHTKYDLEKIKAEFEILKISIDDFHMKKIEKNQKLNNQKLYNWAKNVRAIGKCDICEETDNLTAHHLYDKKTHPTLAYQYENGVCLCKSCHEGFHEMYTHRSQTSPVQYKKYKTKLINEMTMNKIFLAA